MKNIHSIIKKAQSIVLLCCFLLSTLILSAQNKNVTYGITAKAIVDKEGAILIRWAPTNYDTWDITHKYGYKVVRQYIGKDGEKFDEPQDIIEFEQQFLPLSKEEWEFKTRLDTIAYAALYEPEFTVYVGSGNSQSNDLVKAYQLEDEKKNRYMYSLFAAEQSLNVADKLGLLLRDNYVDPKGIYTYYIYPKTADDKMGSPAIVTVTLGRRPPNLPALPKPNVEPGDKVAILNFNVEGLEQEFTSYNIYRDNGAGGTFVKINPNPILFTNEGQGGGRFIYYVDPLPNNTQTFKYYVVGVDAFEQTSPPSPIISVKGIPGELRASVNIKSIIEVNGKISITWAFPDSLNAKIKGFKVSRSEDALGVFKPIQTAFLPNTTRNFSEAPPKGAAYYRVTAYDLYDRSISSIDILGQVKDVSPPAKPVLTTCTCNEQGVGRISWKRNTESDLKGYRVYMSNIKAAENYTQLTADVVTDSTYEYEINLDILNKEIYFNITAEDLHSNQSLFSVPCTMKRPDVIPPVSPVLTKADITSNGVDMAWIPSSSDDVVRHQVERKRLAVDGAWEIAASIPFAPGQKQQSTYVDSTAIGGYTYLYRIAAIDDAELVSYSETMKVKSHTIYKRAPIADMTAYCDCAYYNNITQQRINNPDVSPAVNGTHPIVEIFHAKNPSISGVSPLIDSYAGGAIQKTTDLSVIFEWEYDDANNDLQDFVIYRQLPGQPMVEYGFSKPNQMDVIYDPIVYSFAQQSSVLKIYSNWKNATHVLLPIMDPSGHQTVHQFMDHKVSMRTIKYQPHGAGNTVPVKYFISARFTDGTESPLSAPIELFFK